MEFEKVECVQAFYDDWYCEVFYQFITIPAIDDNNWAISRGGDVAYNLFTDRGTQVDYPNELLELLRYIPENIEIEGLGE